MRNYSEPIDDDLEDGEDLGSDEPATSSPGTLPEATAPEGPPESAASDLPSDGLIAPEVAANLGTLPTSVKATPGDTKESIADYISKRLSEQQGGLKEAQAEADRRSMIANLTEGVGQIGAGLSRADNFNPNSYKSLHEQAENPVKAYIAKQQNKAGVLSQISAEDKLKQEQEANDPNSDEANAARQVYKPTLKKLGIDPAVLDKMGSGQIKNFIQQPLEYQAKMAQAEATANQNYEAKQSRIDQAREASRERAAAASEKADEKKRHEQDTTLNATQQLLESARGNPAAAQAERDLYAAQKVNSLANMYGDPNKLSPQMAALLRAEVGKIATGGTPSMHELEGLDAKPFQTTLSNIWQRFSNQPSPANAAAFLKQYQDYASNLSKDAQKTMTDKYSRIIEPRKGSLGDTHYGNLKQLYIDRFKNEEIPQTKNAAGGHQPGDIVEVKGKGKFKVAADGDSLEPMQ